MFQILLSLFIGVIIGWNFHIYFMALEPKKIPIITPIPTTTPTPIKSRIVVEKNICKPKIIILKSENNSTTVTINSRKDSFKDLLYGGGFNEAMGIYMEANETKLKEYRLVVNQYFNNRYKKNPQKIIDEIVQYIELEPNSLDTKLYLVDIYKERGEFTKAIDMLFNLRDTEDNSTIESSLNSTISEYIKRLKKGNELKKLISFLEDLIYRDGSSKYIIELAQIYSELEDYKRVEELLENIDSSSEYSAKKVSILKEIKAKEKELAQYQYKIPIIKIKSGAGYIVHAVANGVEIPLLIDTGATYTLIDKDILPLINLEKEITLSTAGGLVSANFAHLDSFILDNIELNSFKVTIAPFKNRAFNGLLGMNFFNRFDFKIDQHKNLLYLKMKD